MSPGEEISVVVDSASRFEEQLLPHMDAAYNLARHLTRNDHDAEDVVQEAYLRALRYFGAFRGENGRAWLLAIVSHTAFTSHRRNRLAVITSEFNDELHSAAAEHEGPERDLEHRDSAARLESALDQLHPRYREVLVLRELEGLSYEEIGRIVRAPAGTVMSRLSRARARLTAILNPDRGPSDE